MTGRIAAVLTAVALVSAACSGGEAEPIDLTGGDPVAGAEVYSRHCAGCHGSDALGSDVGPPLVHELYRAGHHADIAFLLAVRNGVRPHHWDYGPMPATNGVSDDEVADMIAYVRGLQQAAGI